MFSAVSVIEPVSPGEIGAGVETDTVMSATFGPVVNGASADAPSVSVSANTADSADPADKVVLGAAVRSTMTGMTRLVSVSTPTAFKSQVTDPAVGESITQFAGRFAASIVTPVGGVYTTDRS